jgi:hypothetical protein
MLRFLRRETGGTSGCSEGNSSYLLGSQNPSTAEAIGLHTFKQHVGTLGCLQNFGNGGVLAYHRSKRQEHWLVYNLS